MDDQSDQDASSGLDGQFFVTNEAAGDGRGVGEEESIGHNTSTELLIIVSQTVFFLLLFLLLKNGLLDRTGMMKSSEKFKINKYQIITIYFAIYVMVGIIMIPLESYEYSHFVIPLSYLAMFCVMFYDMYVVLNDHTPSVNLLSSMVSLEDGFYKGRESTARAVPSMNSVFGAGGDCGSDSIAVDQTGGVFNNLHANASSGAGAVDASFMHKMYSTVSSTWDQNIGTSASGTHASTSTNEVPSRRKLQF